MIQKKNVGMVWMAILACSTAWAQVPVVSYLPSDSVRHYPAPAFVMNALDGTRVSLADFRGKVLVLDFWSTWCGPCHQTFPFVRKTMERYKDDPNVRFLFVDTRERSERVQEVVSAYMAKHSYDFPVVLDERNADGKQEQFYRAFGVVGLPTRLVIDGAGIVRFESIGYRQDVTDDEFSAILSRMIEEAKGAL